MDKITEFANSINCVEGFVGTKVVEERGQKHIVLATTQDSALLKEYQTPPCIKNIYKFAEHFGLHIALIPFVTENGVCFDIVIRERRAA